MVCRCSGKGSRKLISKNYEDLKRIYISMLRNITNNKLIESKQGTKKEERNVRYYNINEDVIKYHLKLNESNPIN